jgi:hypothetical protein
VLNIKPLALYMAVKAARHTTYHTSFLTVWHGYSSSHTCCGSSCTETGRLGKMASPLDHDPTLPQYWSEHPREKALGANRKRLLLQFNWFLYLPSHYHKNTMYLATRHAIYSAALSTEGTATLMFLLSWNKRMTTNQPSQAPHKRGN